jgi:O-methyltransferase
VEDGIVNHLVKSTLKNVARHYGVHIRYMPRLLNKGPDYEVVLPNATYSPWNLDKGFKAAYSKVQDATLVDKYRCFELWRLVEQSAKLETGALIEIGVWRGGTAALIAIQARDLRLNDKTYACDTFSGVVKAGEEDPYYNGGEHADTSRRSVEALFYDTLQLDNIEILGGIFPEETGGKVENLKFRFCHIDVDVYLSTKDVTEWIWERLVPGGIVVYDDYGSDTTPGVARYVDTQLPLRDRTVLHNLNGHAIVIKR